MVKGLVASSNHSLCCMGTDTKYMTPTFLSCSLRILSDKDKYVSDVSLHVATTITWLYCQLGYGSELQDFAPPMTWLYLQFEFQLHYSFLSFTRFVPVRCYGFIKNRTMHRMAMNFGTMVPKESILIDICPMFTITVFNTSHSQFTIFNTSIRRTSRVTCNLMSVS